MTDSSRLASTFSIPRRWFKSGRDGVIHRWSIFRGARAEERVNYDPPSPFSLPCSHVGQESASFLFRATRIITRNDAKSGFRGKKKKKERKKNNNFFFLSLFHGPSLMITAGSLKKKRKKKRERKLHPSRHARGMVIIKVYIPGARSPRLASSPPLQLTFVYLSPNYHRGASVLATRGRDA